MDRFIDKPEIVYLSQSDKDKLLLDQWEEIQRLRARVKELEGQVKKDSRTSSKAPSTDQEKKPTRTRSQRQSSGLKVGGQPGHEYHGLELVEVADHVHSYFPAQCEGCGCDLSAQPALAYDRRQVFDLPPLQVEVTEHRSVCKGCPACGQLAWGDYPESVNSVVQYGERIQALSVYFSDYQLIPYARQQELFVEVFGHSLSVATLQKARQRCAQRLQPVVASIRQALLDEAVLHFDESGFRVAGENHWLHVTSSASLTYYGVHKKRGREALDWVDILPQYQGTAVHDGYSSYHGYAQCDHALCNAHHLRDLTFIHEHHEQAWAKEMMDCLIDGKKAVDKALDKGYQHLSKATRQKLQSRYESILERAREQIPCLVLTEPSKRGRKKQHPAKNLWDRLNQHQQAVLAFIYDFSIPFDNNQAERDIRMLKVQQKISGGFRKLSAAQRFAQIRSYLSSARKQGINMLDALQQVFARKPWMPAITASDP